ncbi:hypothetical protein V6N12_057990 [Hibiscus sabdariffa]|uniref:Uncharacterized protein n=1 Tax=Hibiscus sabdariffa TaxID=183260 RepID=A0ABR1ZDT1_9ROSI
MSCSAKIAAIKEQFESKPTAFLVRKDEIHRPATACATVCFLGIGQISILHYLTTYNIQVMPIPIFFMKKPISKTKTAPDKRMQIKYCYIGPEV